MTTKVKRPRTNEAKIISGFEGVIRYHRRWLKRRGLLDRPWYIMGAAPSPTRPASIPDDTAYVYIKQSGRSAKKLGWPDADLTFLLKKTPMESLEGIALGHVIRKGRNREWLAKLKRLVYQAFEKECELTAVERDSYVIHTLGSLFRGIGVEERPSNGIAIVCLAIAMGVPKIIIAGVSLDTDGYEFDPTAQIRRHVAEDRAALIEMAKRHPNVFTSEQSLHAASGIPLYR